MSRVEPWYFLWPHTLKNEPWRLPEADKHAYRATVILPARLYMRYYHYNTPDVRTNLTLIVPTLKSVINHDAQKN